MEEKKIWYAVQEDSTDGWNYGSYSLDEATEMLRDQGHGLIAVIDEEDSFCLKEYAYSDLIK